MIAAPAVSRRLLPWTPRMGSLAAVTACWLVMGAVLVAPLTLILLRGVFPHILDGSLSAPFSRWSAVISQPDLLAVLANSLELAVLVLAGSLVLGLGAAFLLAHEDLPGRGALRLLCFLPLVTPPYVGALAWMLVMQPNGYAEQLLRLPAAGIQRLFFSVWGIAAVMALHLFPLVMLPARLAFAQAGGRPAAIARLAGASAWQSFRRVTVPLVLPACLSGGLLVFAASMEEFGVAATLGRQANFWVLTTEIDRLVASFPSDPSLGATLSVILMGITLAVFSLQHRVQRRVEYVSSVRLAGAMPLRLGPWRAPAALAVAALGLVAGVVPWLSALLSSLLRALSRGVRADNLTLGRFGVLLGQHSARSALATSLVQAAAGATLAAVVGLAVAYLVLRSRPPGARALDAVTLLPGAVPAIVISVAILTLWNASGVPEGMYRSPFILAVCYAVLALPFAVRYALAGLSTCPPSLEHAARTLGAGPLLTFVRVLLPTLAPWLLAGWLTIFAISMRELVASLLVRPAGTITTAVYIFQRFEQGDSSQGMAMALVTLAVTGLILLLATRLTRRSMSEPLF
ncbi:MAG: ABC transporter permease [Chloroflexota bacterium]